MVHTQNALIFAALCILASALTQESDAENRSPQIHHKEPLDPSDAERRPPHIHGVATHFPPGFHPILGRPPHHNNGETTQGPSDANRRPPHIHDDASSESEGRPPHIHGERPLDNSDAEQRPSHIHEVPHDKPFQFDVPDWIPISPGVNWTPCDIDAGPRARCHDCHTRLFCTRLGGFVIDCPDASYCRNGLCSNVPIAGCH